MSNAALAGLRVLDLGDFVSGPHCARILGDLGAEVIKVEPPAGDTARRLGPFPGDVPSSEASGLFLYLNFNKLGVTLDRSTSSGQRVLHSLLAESDVVVLNAARGRGHRSGLDVQELHARYPDLVLTCVTPFGLEGKYADDTGYDINVSAMGGVSPIPEEPDLEPLMPPSLQIELLSGLGAAFATVAALISRAAGGGGRVVDFAQALFIAAQSGFGLPRREGPQPAAGGRRPRGHYPNHVLHCKDGAVFLFAPQKQQWLGLVQAMDEPEWTKERRFRDRRAMADDYREETDDLVEAWLSQHTKQELIEIFMRHRVPSAPLLNVKDVLESEHLRERGFFQQIDHPVAGPLTYPGFQFRMSGTPMQAVRPAPLLGEHNEQILCGRLEMSRAELTRLRSAGVI